MQTCSPETFKALVDAHGVEGAIKLRYRGTGRTARDVLKLVLKLSEGKTVEIHSTNSPGKTLDYTAHILGQVYNVARTLGMEEIEVRGGYRAILYPPSGGSIKAFSAGACRRGERIPHEMELYELHDC